MFRLSFRSTFAALASAAMLALVTITGASAHVHVDAASTEAGATTMLTFSLSHGCEGSPTTKIAIQIPEGINTVKPAMNYGWTVEKQNETLATPIPVEHGTLTERVSVVTYTAKEPLQDGFYDEFRLQVTLPDAPDGTVLSFPTIQTCEKGETSWIEIPAKGQSEDDLESPAPSITIGEKGGH